tara:strand:+ start:102 stop:887 length:786 start_codon:yes stop_codon:yes gene_type:complete
MATNKYWNSYIYVIRTINKESGEVSLYVGSTIKFDKRKEQHKYAIYNEKSRKDYNRKLYATIRSNSGDWNMEVYKHFRCENRPELEMEEERIRVDLDADLNMKICSTGLNPDEYFQYRREYAKEHRTNNKEKVAEQQRIYNAKNAEKLLEYQNRIYNANVITDEYFQYTKEYRTHNQEKVVEQPMIYNTNVITDEKLLEYQNRIYRPHNQEKIAEQHRIYNANVITDDYFPDTKEYVEEYRTHNEWESAEQYRIYNANIIS